MRKNKPNMKKKMSTIYAGGQANRRPVSAYCTSATGKQPHNNNRGQDQQDQLQVDKPVLRYHSYIT